ncbi:MAG: CRISPR-associated protein Csn1 [Alistipes sp.]|nr:CRISPR-associated protein Csn1 [Alistipes sp.]
MKTLGLDLGTSSIGWAIIDKTNNEEYRLLDKGVDIFQEGVNRTQSGEEPMVKKRTDARALRRMYFRRRLRKIELLKVLARYDMCPQLTDKQLDEWKAKKRYPLDEDFLAWQRTDEATDDNPYRDRYRALTEKLDFGNKKERYALGRAFYHLAQRRGFLSNRKDRGNESEDGTVKQNIKELTAEMSEGGYDYLGLYFYDLYRRKEKIRKRYTARNEHYLAEFNAICARQNLPEELRKALHRAIFFQRDLKSQKGSVGKCTFEKKKPRCPISHPRFEEFRMLSFINNIRVKSPRDNDYRPLTNEEVEKILSLFYRNKDHFDFEDIAKAIAGRKAGCYAYKDDRCEAAYRFNYRMSQSVSGCPVTAALKGIFGDDWQQEIHCLYTKSDGKTEAQIVNDIWHVLFSFADDDKLREWAEKNLQLTDEQASKFVKIRIPQDYAALSLNAIDKMLPYLRRGYRYDEAVFLANMSAVVPKEIWNDDARRALIEESVTRAIAEYRRNPYDKFDTKKRAVRNCLRDCGLTDKQIADRKLYHPSMIETYKDAEPDANGILQLGSPFTSSIRNPMAMRALFRLRALVNRLLKEGKIDKFTKVNIEFARELNTANMRRAIEQIQRENEKQHKDYADEIRKLYSEQCSKEIEPTEDDILKYKLWKEQEHKCLYTGQNICICDFLGASPKFDIEHTVPRARGGDNSQMNKTLCDLLFNRTVKRDKLPSELSNYDEIKARIEALGWEEEIKELEKQINKTKGDFSTKEIKDAMIQKRHRLTMRRDYLKGKCERFMITEVPEGFSNRQKVDTGIIGRYARLYLKTVFEKIYIVKGTTTADLRKAWGLQNEFEKKARVNHVHHCIDAVTIACISGKTYQDWAQFVAETEYYEKQQSGSRPFFPKPWPTFTEDVKSIADELLISHHTADNMPKRSRKKLRVRGKIQYNERGEIKYVQGDTARGSLHQQTFYGAIERNDEIKYVVRKSLDQLQSKEDADKIVDEVVKQKVKEAIAQFGFKEATDTTKHTIWMNEEKRIPIRKVRIFAPTVTSPIHLKPHRDTSAKEYKRDYHVVNDGNYCMAIYEGTDNKGKTKRTFELVNNIEAAQYFKTSADKTTRPDLIPQSDENGYPLRCILKTGTMVLFYENTPEELYECTKKELAKRLYKVATMSTLTIQQKYNYGTINVRHHQEARPAGDLKAKNGVWKIGEEYRPIISIYHTQLNAYIEGYDFELTVTGEIKFKH